MRMEALSWWRNLSPKEQKEFQMKHFPNKSFIEVTTSSMLIEKMYKIEVS